MVRHQSWKDIQTQLYILYKGRSLLSKIFCGGILRELPIEEAEMLAEFKDGTAQTLMSYGVISERDGYLVLENPHLDYFLECQAVNRRISVGAVQDCLDRLQTAIGQYRLEKNEKKKSRHHREVQKALETIELQARSQCAALKHEISETYKQESNLEKKIYLLENYRDKSEAIYKLVQECERILSSESLFFSVQCDENTKRIRIDVLNSLMFCHNYLISLTREVVQYLTQFRQMEIINKKLRKLKELKDQKILEAETNIEQLISEHPAVHLDKPDTPHYKVSIEDFTQNISPEMITQMLQSRGLKAPKRPLSPPLLESELNENAKVVKKPTLDYKAVWNSFAASSNDLMSFLMARKYDGFDTWPAIVSLFCLLVKNNINSCKIKDDFASQQGVSYPLVYAK